MPSNISVISPTNPVCVIASLIRHFKIMTIHALTGPIEKPARSAGSSLIWISKNPGNINGNGNFAKAYKIKESAVKIATFAIYAVVNFAFLNCLRVAFTSILVF